MQEDTEGIAALTFALEVTAPDGVASLALAQLLERAAQAGLRSVTAARAFRVATNTAMLRFAGRMGFGAVGQVARARLGHARALAASEDAALRAEVALGDAIAHEVVYLDLAGERALVDTLWAELVGDVEARVDAGAGEVFRAARALADLGDRALTDHRYAEARALADRALALLARLDVGADGVGARELATERCLATMTRARSFVGAGAPAEATRAFEVAAALGGAADDPTLGAAALRELGALRDGMGASGGARLRAWSDRAFANAEATQGVEALALHLMTRARELMAEVAAGRADLAAMVALKAEVERFQEGVRDLGPDAAAKAPMAALLTRWFAAAGL